jgi:pilus assembly protein CpaE
MDNRFVLVTARQEQFNWLSESLTGIGVIIWDKGDNKGSLIELIGSIGVRVVFLDFNPDATVHSAAMAEELLKVFPSLWLVGVGKLDSGDNILTAMRAGAREFIEDSIEAERVRDTVQKLLIKAPPLPASPRGKMLALIGGRPGMGTSMAAVHLALTLKTEFRHDEEVLLLDFGYPQGDASLYLDTKLSYTLSDAIRSVRRLDHALIKAAFIRHKSGLAVLPLPQNMAELQESSAAEVMNLLALLKFFFKYIVVDLGGFMGTDFLLHVLGVADRSLLLCEQTVPACRSAHQLLQRLENKGFDRKRIGLVIAKHDAKIGMSPRQVVKMLELEEKATLPARHYALLECANEGRSLLDNNPKDPYLKHIRQIAQDFDTSAVPVAVAPSGLSGWIGSFSSSLRRAES